MAWSHDLSQLDRGLREAGPASRQLRYYLLRHFSELIQQLTCSLESDVEREPLGREAEAAEEVPAGKKAPAAPPQALGEASPGPWHDSIDDAWLRELRQQALQTFDECSLSGIAYGVLWIDAVPAGGRSLVLCMATTADGYRHMLLQRSAPCPCAQAAAARLAPARSVCGSGPFMHHKQRVAADARADRVFGLAPSPVAGETVERMT